MKFAVSAILLGVASAATCPLLAQEAFNDANCTDQQNGSEQYIPLEGCAGFNDQRKNTRALWTMSGGKVTNWPAALMSDCTVSGHHVKFFSDTECKNLVKEYTVSWGPQNTCVRLGTQFDVWMTEVVVDQTWFEDQKKKESSSWVDDDTPEHWKAVWEQCKDDRQLEPECIEAFYHAMDMDNGAEWLWSLEMWYHNQPWIGLFGWPLSWFAGLCGWWYLFFPENLPHISDAPWSEVGAIRGLGIKIVTWTYQMLKPEAFGWTQLFTWGESNMRDLELIYTDPFDAVIWFWVESLVLPWMSFNSLIWTGTFWWLYAAELFWFGITIFFKIFISEDD